MKNLILYTTSILLLCGIFISCEDYIDKEIEAQWQLKEMRMDNETSKVDTIYYSFKKDVFRYLRVEGDTPNPPASFGKFTQNGNLLNIEIVPEQTPDYTGWVDGKKSFTIQKLNGSDLILESNDTIYVFRKY